MAIFHLTAKTVARASGRSAVAAAAYRCGTRLLNERDGLAHDFRARSGVVSTFIVAPDAAPAWTLNRQSLWSAAEIRETRLNAVTAREWEAALPDELDAVQREALVRQFAAAMVERFGVVADCAIHAPSGDGDQRNHHLHMLTTTRAVGADGLGAKTRALDDRKSNAVEGVRALWETLTNDALEAAGTDARIDRRSLKAQAAAAAQEATSALQIAEKAARSLNPIGKRRKVQTATESAQEALQRVEAVSRPPTTHVGPQRTAEARRAAKEAAQQEAEKEARAQQFKEDEARKAQQEARAQRLVDGLVSAGRRAELMLSVTAADYRDRLVKTIQRASDILDDMDQKGAVTWARSFVARGGFVVDVFRKRLSREGVVSVAAEGDHLADGAAAHASGSLESRAFVAWSAAAAEDDAPAAQHEAELRALQPAPPRKTPPPPKPAPVPKPVPIPRPIPAPAPEPLLQRNENHLRNLELSAISSMKEGGEALFYRMMRETRDEKYSLDRARAALRGRLNHDFGRVWPEAVQAEFKRVMTLEELLPKPEPVAKPSPPQSAPDPEKPAPQPPRPSGPSM